MIHCTAVAAGRRPGQNSRIYQPFDDSFGDSFCGLFVTSLRPLCDLFATSWAPPLATR